MTTRVTLVAVTVVSLLTVGLISFRIYQDNDRDITSFVAFGEDDEVRAEYGRSKLGAIFLRPDLGHDGKFFFIQANDPFLLDPQANARYLDDPVYRAQRMLYPALAGVGGVVSPAVIVWLMLLINVVSLGLGALVVGLVADHMGASAWWGLAFPLNVGLISELSIGGAGILAAASGFAAIAALQRNRFWLGATFLVASALSREVMLVLAIGAGFWLWTNRRRRGATIAMSLPMLAVAVWTLYVRLQVDASVADNVVRALGWPFVGIWNALNEWMGDPFDLAVGLVLLTLLTLFVRRVRLSGSLIGVAHVGFVALALFFTVEVWRNYFDITRALAPVITAFVLLVAAPDLAVDRDSRIETGGSR